MTDPLSRRKLAAILSADVVGYSRLMATDEAATVETLKSYRSIIARLVARHGGRVVNAPGDALLAEFPSAVEAVQAAVEAQKSLEGHNVELEAHRRMQFRIGVNLGDVIEDADGTIYGDGVNIAARMEALAEAGGICISSTVYDAVEGKLSFGFDFLGEQQVKNIPRPVRVYRVRAEARPTPVARAAHRTGLRLSALVLAVAVVAVVGLWFYGHMGTQAPQKAATDDPILALPKGPSIAVLPFANLSGDPQQDYFADGISEQIITGLARFRELLVIARNSTFRYKGKAVDVREVGKELGVRYVLEGSVQRAKDRVRVTAQLLDARTGAHLWADTYDRALTASNLFSVQDDITERVVGALGGVYGPMSLATFEQSKGKAAESLDAYECVLRYFAYERELTPSGHLSVRDCLERAVKLAPTYADAWAALAFTYTREYAERFNPRPDPLGRALQAARKAVELDPASQYAHIALARVFFFMHDIAAFEAEATRFLDLNPNNADAVGWYGLFWTYAHYGDPIQRARGVAVMKKAIALNPMHPLWYYLPIAWDHYYSGRLEAALAEAKKIDMPGFYWSHALRAVVYGAMNRKEDAQPAVAKLLQLYPEFPRHFRQDQARWNVTPDQIEQQVSDYRKVGLEIPNED